MRTLPLLLLCVACDSETPATPDALAPRGTVDAAGPRADALAVGDGAPGDAAARDAALSDAAPSDAAPSDASSDVAVGDPQSRDAAPDGGPVCEVVTASADPALRPVDIVWIIDASASMGEEIAIVEQNLNDFAARIDTAGLDYRVVLIGSDREQCGDGRCYFPICVPEPLSGAPGCPDTDGPRYQHVRAPVHSGDAFDVALATWPQWAPGLRPQARTHFVVVTDDNAGWGAEGPDFANAAAGLDWVMHSVVDTVGRLPNCGLFDEPPCSCGEERGQAYIDLSEQTGGLVQSVCAPRWDDLFTALEARVVGDARIPCAFDIPDFGEGIALDPERLNVTWIDADGMRTPLANVEDAGGCARGMGWYYDDPQNPTSVRLCPELCGAQVGSVEVEFGCRIRKI
jgi:hypothetical protein